MVLQALPRLRQVDGRRKDPQRHASGEERRHSPVHGGDAVGADQQVRHHGEGGGGHLHATAARARLQAPGVQHRGPRRSQLHPDMSEREVGVLVQLGVDQAVAAPGDHHILVLEQGHARVVRGHVLLEGDQEVRLRPLDALHRAGVDGNQSEAHARRCEADRAQARGQGDDGGIVRRDDAEAAGRRGRVELGAGGDGGPDLQQGGADRFGQLLGPRRQHHPSAGRRQQVVVEELPQAVERTAHGRLAEVDRLGRLGDVLLGQQGVQRDQQVQVQSLKPHAAAFADRRTR